MPLLYTAVATTVKPATNFSIDEQLADLRLRLVVGEVNKRVGQRIRARRKELGLTQKQVAGRMREHAKSRGEEEPAVDAQRVSDWERSYNMPTERYLTLLVAALELGDVSEFYEEAQQPEELSTPFPFPSTNGTVESELADIKQELADIKASQLALLGDLQEIRKALQSLAKARRSQAS